MIGDPWVTENKFEDKIKSVFYLHKNNIPNKKVIIIPRGNI
jgi:hypothetical protein